MRAAALARLRAVAEEAAAAGAVGRGDGEEFRRDPALAAAAAALASPLGALL